MHSEYINVFADDVTRLRSRHIWQAFVSANVLPDFGGAPRAQHLAEALSQHAVQLLYVAIVTTAVAQQLQVFGQRSIRAQDAAIIYALDPVYAATFSYWLLGEQLGARGVGGTAVVMGAVLLSRADGQDDRNLGDDRGDADLEGSEDDETTSLLHSKS